MPLITFSVIELIATCLLRWSVFAWKTGIVEFSNKRGSHKSSSVDVCVNNLTNYIYGSDEASEIG